MVVLRPYLSVKNALDAVELYKNIFKAELTSHMPVDKEGAKSFGLDPDMDLSRTTMHCAVKIGEAMFYMSDNFTGEVLEKTNMSVLIEPESEEEIKNFYDNAEKNGCKITMKLEKQFWGDWFASFKDPFGISWQMNYSPAQE
ncbi:MAG: glyoxalase/bleomycin resistance/extradiol dioxygenase family protein [Candidatus Heimdallarchaeota archaeon]|nr:glyoxalase/bleomycin resistance/extradiol dioxygenase family protein [Candidatus Heimdallarchaeota archaeon]